MTRSPRLRALVLFVVLIPAFAIADVLPSGWQDLPLEEFMQLAGRINSASASPEVLQARADLAQRGWDRFLSSPEFIASAEPLAFHRLVGMLGTNLSAGQRDQVGVALRQRFTQEQTNLNALSSDQRVELWSTLSLCTTDSSSLAEVIAGWVNSEQAFSSSSAMEYWRVLSLLEQGTSPSVQQAKTKARSMATALLQQATFVNQAQPSQINILLTMVGDNLAGEQKDQLASLLKQRFVQDPAVLGALSSNERVELWSALTRSHVDPRALADLVAQWVIAKGATASTSPQEYSRVMSLLEQGNSPAVQQAKATVVSQTVALLQDQAFLATVQPSQLSPLLNLMGTSLTAAQKQQVTTAVQQRFAQNQGMLNALSTDEREHLWNALLFAGMDQAALADLVAGWMNGEHAAGAASAKEVARVMSLLEQGSSDAVQQAKAKARSQAAALLQEGTFTVSARPSEVNELLRIAGGDIPAQNKAQLAAALQQRFAPDQATMNALSSAEREELWSSLLLCGMDSSGLADLVATWVAGKESFSTMSTSELRRVVQLLQPGRSDSARQAKSKAESQIRALLQDPGFLGRAEPSQVLDLLSMNGGSLSREQGQAVAAALRQRFAENEAALKALSPDQRVHLWDALLVAGMEQSALAELVAGSVNADPKGPGSTTEFVRVMTLLEQGNSTSVQQAKASMRSQALALLQQQSFLAQAQPSQVTGLLDIVGAELTAEQLAQVDAALEQRFVSTAQIQSLDNQQKVALWNAIFRYGDAAEATTRLRMKLLDQAIGPQLGVLSYSGDINVPAIAAPKLDGPMRDLLRQRLIDPSGAVQGSAAVLLTWYYREHAGMEQWMRLLEEHLADAQITGDRKAGWLLARGYAQAAADAEFDLLSGEQWIKQALAEAQSEPVRLECVETLFRGYLYVGSFDRAISLLDSVEDQFTLPASRQLLAGWRQLIPQAEEDLRQLRLAAEEAAHQAHLKILRERLDTAQKRHDAERTARYQQLLVNQK